MMFWWGGHWAFWQAGLMWLGMIVFWGLIIWGIYALISSTTRKPGSDRGSDARRILDERLARGEIDTAEYQRLRDLMTSGATPPKVGSGSSS